MASFSTRTLFSVFIILTGILASANLSLNLSLPILNLYLNLSLTFYDNSCPDVVLITQRHVKAAVDKEPRMAASLLRLYFHDCFVNGCDGSILLNDTATFTGEKTAIPNANSVRGFEVIDSIKAELESKCPGTVSCADIVALAAREAVVLMGGPSASWDVPLGRKDSTTANLSAANSELPSPFANLSALKTSFANKGFDENEMVALSGAHTLGKARCRVFRTRIYNDTNIDPAYATSLKQNCTSVGGDDNLSPLDTTENVFDNIYFQDLVNLKGLLHSDQELFNGGSTDALVRTYSQESASFISAFKAAMFKMGKLGPPPGTGQEIRSQCWKVNGS